MTKKVLLLNIGFRAIQNQWFADSGGIWCIPFRATYPEMNSTLLADLTQKNYLTINSVTYQGGDLQQVTSWTDTVDGRATALSSEKSFIWDTAKKNLYIRLENYDDPRVYTIFIGVAISLSDQSYDDTVNSILFREDIISLPDLSESKDPLFFDKLSFPEFTIKLNNAGRKYDYLTDNRIFNQSVQHYWGDPTQAFSTFDQINEAKITTYQFDDDEVSLRAIDGRASLSRAVPPNNLTVADYPDLSDDYIGQPKPLVYGQVRNLPCIPLDDGTTQTNYTFMIADTEFHNIKSTGYTIYMDGTDKTAQVLNFSASAGTFQLPAVHYDVGKDVTFTGGGYVEGAAVIENPLDIIEDLFENYLFITYSATSFNTTEWAATKALLGNIAFAVQEKRSIIGIIEDICAGTGLGFLLERDGRYTGRYYDPTAAPVLTVHENQWMDEPIIVGKEEEILTSATVKYNQGINNEKWSRYTDDSQEEDIYAKFGIYRNREFETLYSSSTDAQAFAESIMERSNDVGFTIAGTLKDMYVDLTEVKIGKIAQIEVNRQVTKNSWSTWLGKMKCEIIGVYPDLKERKCEIIFRRIEDIDDFALSEYRITEADNFRITEDGNLRITEVM